MREGPTSRFEALGQIANVANQPIVTDTEIGIGRGATGGFVTMAAPTAEAAARVVLRVLNGEKAADIPITTGDFVKPLFDWRQLQRWRISESACRPESEVRFRELTLWDQYRWQIMFIAAAFLIQTGLIVGLFFEHRRRRYAEITSRTAVGKLAQMNCVATAGELSASIAHEVNQPLSAIVNYGSAALRWLARPEPDLDEVRTSLEDIVNQGHRASEVIGNVRAMFNKDSGALASLFLLNIARTFPITSEARRP